MDKVKVVYEGIFILGLMFLVVVSFLYLVLTGICVENWILPNAVFLSVMEIAILIWMAIYIKKGSAEVLRETRSLIVLKRLYLRIIVFYGFGIIFGIIQLLSFFGFWGVSNENSYQLLYYALNVIGVSLAFFVWMFIAIRKIDKRLRF